MKIEHAIYFAFSCVIISGGLVVVSCGIVAVWAALKFVGAI